MKFTVDFRSVYATILDRWLGVDSRSVLGGTFENVGFLGSAFTFAARFAGSI
ncbi:MAG TPA: hypothetical protein VN937_21395 [Blastocatellia bacterium]|nr:hypothetical protein [Blastocatellia bacterium]